MLNTLHHDTALTSVSNINVDGDRFPLLLWQWRVAPGGGRPEESGGEQRMSSQGDVRQGPAPTGVLHGIRVVELADEQAAHAGLVLAGLGADVIKVEPP